jgi:ABC-type bacteriocin/lantibiotic exporter with double-glycine peptidase domain
VTAVDAEGDETTWAAAMATVLNTKTGDYTVDSLCSAAHTEKVRKSWSEVEALGANLGMHTAKCNAGSQAAWAGVLQHNGALLAGVPGQEYQVIVVAGIKANGDLYVVDPSQNFDDWLDFSTFTERYGMGDGHQVELLAVS